MCQEVVLERAFRIAHDNPPKWLLMLTAYVDESGQSQDGWMFLAGYIGTDEAWRSFVPKWKDAIAPREHLHMRKIQISEKQPRRHRNLLARAGAVPKAVGLEPFMAGVRYSDYSDLVAGTRLEHLVPGYILCCIGLVMSALLALPEDERLEVFFEQQVEYQARVVLAMNALSRIDEPKLNTPNGLPKLANWGSISKSTNSLTEPADLLAYALLQRWRDKTSLKAQVCSPILDAHGNRGIGAVITKDMGRQILEHTKLLQILSEMRRLTS